METTTQNKQPKLFCDLKEGDVIYHMIYNINANNEWVLEKYDKITISYFDTKAIKECTHTTFKGLKQNMLYDDVSAIYNTSAVYDTYGIDDCDYEKHICSWTSLLDKLCIFSTSSFEDSKDEIDKIILRNSSMK